MPLNPHLNFDGNTREVVMYYASVFGLDEPQILTFGSMPGVPPEAENNVMHTFLTIAGTKLMFSDTLPGMSFQQGNNFTLAYVSADEAALRDAFHKLSKDGNVGLELQETPWSKCYGQLIDKYGIGWQFSHEAE